MWPSEVLSEQAQEVFMIVGMLATGLTIYSIPFAWAFIASLIEKRKIALSTKIEPLEIYRKVESNRIWHSDN